MVDLDLGDLDPVEDDLCDDDRDVAQIKATMEVCSRACSDGTIEGLVKGGIKTVMESANELTRAAATESLNDMRLPYYVAGGLAIDGNLLYLLGEKLQADKALAKIAARQNGLSLQHAAEKLQDDEELVKLAVRQNGLSLQYASQKLKADTELVKIAVRQNGQSLQYASQELKDDDEVFVSAMKSDCSALCHASPRFQSDDMVLALAYAMWEADEDILAFRISQLSGNSRHCLLRRQSDNEMLTQLLNVSAELLCSSESEKSSVMQHGSFIMGTTLVSSLVECECNHIYELVLVTGDDQSLL
mmetsp:Transcript_28749/g.66775  ORF Transcript_28749/g.66775 Transcript_28749/m.66775 type:complete len:302 (-) Transcript_28749:221-1126(-)